MMPRPKGPTDPKVIWWFALPLLAALVILLTGCMQTAMEDAERADHASCIKLLAERGQNPNDQQAYATCRQSFASYRRDRAIRLSGD